MVSKKVIDISAEDASIMYVHIWASLKERYKSRRFDEVTTQLVIQASLLNDEFREVIYAICSLISSRFSTALLAPNYKFHIIVLPV